VGEDERRFVTHTTILVGVRLPLNTLDPLDQGVHVLRPYQHHIVTHHHLKKHVSKKKKKESV
jgi:hypothetical protein